MLLSFFGDDPNSEWSGDDEACLLDDSTVQRFSLACEPGELICYGAWEDGDETLCWGVGAEGIEGCDNCRAVCDSGETDVRVLR